PFDACACAGSTLAAASAVKNRRRMPATIDARPIAVSGHAFLNFSIVLMNIVGAPLAGKGGERPSSTREEADPPRSAQHSNSTPIRVSTARGLALRGLARSNRSVVGVWSRSLPAHDRSVHSTPKGRNGLLFFTNTVSKGNKLAIGLAIGAGVLTTPAAAAPTPS